MNDYNGLLFSLLNMAGWHIIVVLNAIHTIFESLAKIQCYKHVCGIKFEILP